MMQRKSNYTLAVVKLWEHTTALSRKIDLSLGSVHGIGLTEYMVLYHLMSAPNQSLRRVDLAEAVGRTASGVTRMLQPMEKMGLVKKESNPRDARVSLVKMTPAGETIYKESSVTLNEKSKQLLRRIELGKINELLDILSIMESH